MSDILTDLFIRNLKPAEKEYTRREKGGFDIRVHPSGRKTFTSTGLMANAGS